MRISFKAYKEILNFFHYKYEQGCILGSNGKCVAAFAFDDSSKRKQEYIPNIRKLNRIITKWKRENITFVGLIHSHTNPVGVYSKTDYLYFQSLFEYNKDSLTKLYFPILYKDDNNEVKINVYYFDINGLHEENLEIVNE